MAHRLDRLKPLEGDQLRASSPADHAALSASAGTGKTHVLTARVLRLLLSGVDPATILCLTFTKAGAAEMADRIHRRLAHWVRLKDVDLGLELLALGESSGPEARENARTLFARVLDASGGGLRIQTIHAFAQSLLGSFPAEAGLVPGFRPLEGREQQLLERETLAGLLVAAERNGDDGLIRDVQALSRRLGEGGAEAFLIACGRKAAAMTALGPRETIEARLRAAFDLPEGDIEEAIAAACGDADFDMASLAAVAEANAAWGTATGIKAAEAITAWRGSGPAERAVAIEALAALVLTKTGEMRVAAKGLLGVSPDYADHAGRLGEACRRLRAMRSVAALVAALAAGLRAGQAFAAAYAGAKRAAGVADFDDIIRWTEDLLTRPGMGDWVRYKLDQATDHILVDEAQDTNRSQWAIVEALTEEFFAGEGARGRHRTIFTVGDFKQAIFRFQGTDPRQFERARAHFEDRAGALREAALDADLERLPPAFLDLSMDRSFRSAPEVLGVVDRLIADLGHEKFGLVRRPNPHESHHTGRPGSVTLWQPFSDAADAEEDSGEEGWVSDTVRRYAARLARQIRAWLDDPFHVASKGRPLRPEDILILVRRRGTLAALIVARLHAEGVPVAGVDRLLLSAPLAVRDLLAAARFAVQPLDDLNFAGLLVSPLFGWSQDQLYAVARERNGALWDRVRDCGDADTRAGLHAILNMADFATPHAFFEEILSGPIAGRRKLAARLGAETRDPVEELLSSAIEFEKGGAPSLQRFLDWFARGEVEVVRDPSQPMDAVRVMTVHGAKGLQAPVVILADACVDPDRSRGGFESLRLAEGEDAVPIFRPRKAELAEPLKSHLEAQDELDAEEHWRLLYVALTRAEERLVIGGALGAADRGVPPQTSWYAALDATIAAMGGDWEKDGHWGRARTYGAPLTKVARQVAVERTLASLPDWLGKSAPVEARPPRPLAPSSIGEDDVASPPPGPAMRAAAERGRLLHQLFERLPDVPAEERASRADRWLERAGGIADATLRGTLTDQACAIIADPAHAEIFSPDALAEAPIAAVISEGIVVAGKVDRLLVTKDRVRFVDFKTGRLAPNTLSEVPDQHIRQMGAYAAALAVIFPGRAVEAALLYTAGPTLIDLDPGMLAANRPELQPAGG
ncbi:double-strand break repair helicase AddA [Allosphingosinicella indica]|uniref:DNA 3'-5' helicase n=1 Tax=Allosphingosinicella indica TaxID=941907 RepID=A0A1X7H364_9SPHN|nr:double-strand break repair helicase AddA [Allosphingosinicella indica]SMF78797.1 DNA helicase/exodeoxyribonuclease V, subunit A [Allosphingosinicella indica]